MFRQLIIVSYNYPISLADPVHIFKRIAVGGLLVTSYTTHLGRFIIAYIVYMQRNNSSVFLVVELPTWRSRPHTVCVVDALV